MASLNLIFSFSPWLIKNLSRDVSIGWSYEIKLTLAGEEIPRLSSAA